jgi:hypothetical protein
LSGGPVTYEGSKRLDDSLTCGSWCWVLSGNSVVSLQKSGHWVVGILHGIWLPPGYESQENRQKLCGLCDLAFKATQSHFYHILLNSTQSPRIKEKRLPIYGKSIKEFVDIFINTYWSFTPV